MNKPTEFQRKLLSVVPERFDVGSCYSPEDYSYRDGFDRALEVVKSKLMKLSLDERKIEQAMLNISHKKGELQIKEVNLKGVWGADLITINFKEIASALTKSDIVKEN